MSVSKKINVSGTSLVFVTTTIENWEPLFNDKEIAKIIALQLNETATFFNVSIVGYVIMPNHIHMLLGLKNYKNLPKFIQSFKSLSSRKVKRLLEVNNFKLWMRRYDSFVITSEKQFRIKLEYVHNNPVRQKLIDNPIDWEFSSAKQWLTDSTDIVKVDKDFSWI